MKCLNCDSELQGRYCAQCGQRHDPHAPTAGHLLAEAAEGLTHGDSRLWLTLRYLLTQPGFLTVEFFAGRRARFLPPVRLYLVVSVVFFLLLALLPGSSDSAIEVDQGPQSCAELTFNGPLAAWFEPKLRAACERTMTDGGEALGAAFLRNIPKAMFVLLPLFAFLMLPFFLRPRRLYAEHAIFLIHTHTACFAVLSGALLIGLLLPQRFDGWLSFVVVAYLLWYVFQGMRRVYGGSRTISVLRFLTLGLLYLFCAGGVLAFTGLAAALEL